MEEIPNDVKSEDLASQKDGKDEENGEKSPSTKSDENEESPDADVKVSSEEAKESLDLEEEKKPQEDDKDQSDSVKIENPLTLSSIQRAATRGFKASIGEVFFVRFHVDPSSSTSDDSSMDPESAVCPTSDICFLVGGTVYFEKKNSRQKFLDGKEFCVCEDGVKVVVFTKEAAAVKKKGKLPGSYPD